VGACSSDCDQHQGDWEMVEVAVNPQGAVPWVAYSEHQNDFQFSEQKISSEQGESSVPVGLAGGSHPIVFVAHGTHVNYPLRCSAGGSNCYTGATLDVFGGGDLANFGEAGHDGSQPWGENSESTCAGECVINLDTADFMWSALPAVMGLYPPVSAPSIDHLAAAPGGPDSPESNHDDFYDGSVGPVSGRDSLQQEIDHDGVQ
jgi:hypothetical protein